MAKIAHRDTMSSSTWQTLSRLFLTLAFVSLGGIGWTWWTCADDVASHLDDEFSIADETPLAVRVRAVRASFEANDQEVPEQQPARVSASRGVCTTEFPVGESAPFGFGFVFLGIMAIMARNQSRIIEERDIEDRATVRRVTRALPAIHAHESDKPKPLEPVSLDVGIDLSFGAQPEEAHGDDDEDASLMSFVVERAKEEN